MVEWKFKDFKTFTNSFNMAKQRQDNFLIVTQFKTNKNLIFQEIVNQFSF